ncbi:DUF4437 domain-containing protein [Mangrovibacterium sp.]|uniref:DUF4437 domain-containing protein n=1 Tax=Mangrovibacterium sp. TaxID=1961364 RepID=UPI00356748BE
MEITALKTVEAKVKNTPAKISRISAFLFLSVISLLVACTGSHSKTGNPNDASDSEATYEVVSNSEVEWSFLNPKRGDKAPMAGTLWGDRNGTEPTGFLLKPSDGFSSPPHIHNVSYRGVVIRGLIHNDDPTAANMWMPTGSFWTQPKGEVHITAAKGTNSLAYIEIEEGPYLVLPEEEAFDNGERPLNLEQSNIVWVGASDITWVDQAATTTGADAPKVAFLWGSQEDSELRGNLIKLPAGFAGAIQSNGSSFRAVVIQGQAKHQIPGSEDSKSLDPGSYFASQGAGTHLLVGNTAEETVIYVRTNGSFSIHSNQ